MITPLDILSVETWILLLTVFGLISYYIHRKWQLFKSLSIPHDPPSIFKLGHLLTAVSNKTAFDFDNEQKQKHGPVWGSYYLVWPVLTIHDPDVLRQVLIKEFKTFPNRQKKGKKIDLKELNDGLTTVQGDQWKRIRATMTPTFSTSKLKQMAGIIEWCAENTIRAFERKIQNGDGTFNAKEIFSRLSLDVVCSAAFSTNVDSQNDTVGEPEIVKHAKNLFAKKTSAFTLLLRAIFGVSNYQRSAVEYFRNLTNMIIGQRNNDPHFEGRVDLMQLMLDSEISEEEAKNGPDRGMTKSEIVGNAMLMIIAGYENTGNQMGFLAYNFAQHPKIQEDVQKEIDEMIKNHGQFDYEALSSLKYLDMCINENLRLYFPLIRGARLSESEITVSGVNIPKGMTVLIPSYGLAHDPQYWDEPFEFRPERMRDMSQIDPMVFQPFGAGPRNCIGMRFALMEIKLSFAKILHNFTFMPSENTPKPPLKMAFGAILRAADDFNLRAVPRKKS